VSDKAHDFVPSSLVCIYAQLLPRIRSRAKELGYAIAVHGSMTRDFDLLAVPWIKGAAPAKELVDAIAQEVNGFVIGDENDKGALKRGELSQEPTKQPHGRMSWNICWGGRAFIDLSVMPRQPTE
jgi:hypothetical protein